MFLQPVANTSVFINASGFKTSATAPTCTFYRLLYEGWKGIFVGPKAEEFSGLPGKMVEEISSWHKFMKNRASLGLTTDYDSIIRRIYSPE